MTDYRNKFTNSGQKITLTDALRKEELFDTSGNKIIQSISDNSYLGEAESERFIKSYIKQRSRYIPKLDYSDPSSFCFYGSSERYYKDSIDRVYNTYPYDGSKAEKMEWSLTASYLDLYMLEHEYPKAKGHVAFSNGGWGTRAAVEGAYGLSSAPEYIYFVGGPHSGTMFNSSKKRESNLKIDGSTGNTAEFWLKKQSFVGSSLTTREVIFDAHTSGSITGTSKHGRFTVLLDSSVGSGSPFKLTYLSGTAGITDQVLGTTAVTKATVADNAWHHYAVTVVHSGSNIVSKLYVDGVLEDTNTASVASFGSVDRNFVGTIGALATGSSGGTAAKIGYGKLSGSLDEFRYWKTARTEKQIGRYFYRPVHGGTDKDNNNPELGLYYKFNEGIIGVQSYDEVVLDYSGRIGNGKVIGWSNTFRSSTSGIESSTNLPEDSYSEPGDPIINGKNPLVQALLTKFNNFGKSHDIQNGSSLANTVPSYFMQEDKTGLMGELVQIIAATLDDIFLKIKFLPNIKDYNYRDFFDQKGVQQSSDTNNFLLGCEDSTDYKFTGNHSKPWVNYILEHFGLATTEIFPNADLIETFLQKSDKLTFEQNLHEVKNAILSNIHSNLIHIYNTKGTEKSFRNLIRCFGVDDELIKLNVYGNNESYKLEKKPIYTTVKQKSLNFANANYQGTLYQTASNKLYMEQRYITSSTAPKPLTLEASIVFPDNNSITTNLQTASLFGMHSVQGASGSGDALTWHPLDSGSMQAYFVRRNNFAGDGYFLLTSSAGAFTAVSSSYIPGVYDNTHWNISVRVAKKGDIDFGLTKLSGSTGYKVEFTGYNYDLDVLKNSFYVTSSITRTGYEMMSSLDRAVYAGSHKTNFTGSHLQSSDIRLLGFNVHLDGLTNDELKEHAKNPAVFGRTDPQHVSNFDDGSNLRATDATVLRWQFENLVSSSAGGTLSVLDFTSGSIETPSGSLVGYKYPGAASGFAATGSAIVQEFIPSVEYAPIDNVYSSDRVQIKSTEVEKFTAGSRPVTYFYSFEKSMYQVISKEMINMFAGITGMSNLIGEPVNKYRQEYKMMEKMREKFFRNVENDMDLDKFVEYYKWIDSSLSHFVQQLVPASSNFAGRIRDIVESHALERNKYKHQAPTVEYKDPTVSPTNILGVNELLYDWEHGHAPLQNTKLTNVKALQFSANGDTVDIADSANLSFTDGAGTDSAFSISAWVKVGDITSDSGVIISRRNSVGVGIADGEWIIGHNNGGLYVILYADPAQNGVGSFVTTNRIYFEDTGTKLSSATWHFVTVTYDGSENASGLKVYKDSTEITTAAKTKTNYAGMANFDIVTTIGGTDSPTTNTFDDFIADVTVFDKALTAAEITEVYNGGKVKNLTTFSAYSNIISWWKMGDDLDAAGSNNIKDYKGSNHGTMVGSTAIVASTGLDSDREVVDPKETTNCLWQKDRSERSSDRETIRRVAVTDVSGSTYVLRKLSRPYRFSAEQSKPIGTGFNRKTNKNPELYKMATKAGKIELAAVTEEPVCKDVIDPNFTEHYRGSTNNINDDSYLDADSDLLFPFTMISSSVGVDLEQVKENLQIANNHLDIGLTGEQSLQSPFTRQHVGGMPHRKVEMGLTGSDVRPEAYNLTASNSTMILTTASIDSPKSMFYRDGGSGAPYMFKNVKHGTGSSILGNYNKDYEIVQTSGRSLNNNQLVDDDGLNVAPVASKAVSGTIDFVTPVRQKTGHVIVNKFSSPGGPETQGAFASDQESQEYSIYNSLNYRNSTIRNTLNKLSAEQSDQFGYRSGSTAQASVHMTNRNATRRTGSLGKEVDFDNNFIRRPIPQTDYQYSWITASATDSVYDFLERNDNFGYTHEYKLEKDLQQDNIQLDTVDGLASRFRTSQSDQTESLISLQHVTGFLNSSVTSSAFEKSFDICGRYFVVGGTENASNPYFTNRHGHIQVYYSASTGWERQHVTSSTWGTTEGGNANFGSNVRIFGDHIFAPEYNYAEDASWITAHGRGRINVYKRSGTSWNYEQALTASTNTNALGNLGLGGVSAVHENRYATWSFYHDRIFIFKYLGSKWTLENPAGLDPDVARLPFGGIAEMVLSGSYLFISPTFSNQYGPVDADTGVKVFFSSSTGWALTQTFSKDTGLYSKLAYNGENLVVSPGLAKAYAGLSSETLSTNVYTSDASDGTGWTLQQSITPPGINASDFMYGIASSGNILAIATSKDDIKKREERITDNEGSLHVYVHNGAEYVRQRVVQHASWTNFSSSYPNFGIMVGAARPAVKVSNDYITAISQISTGSNRVVSDYRTNFIHYQDHSSNSRNNSLSGSVISDHSADASDRIIAIKGYTVNAIELDFLPSPARNLLDDRFRWIEKKFSISHDNELSFEYIRGSNASGDLSYKYGLTSPPQNDNYLSLQYKTNSGQWKELDFFTGTTANGADDQTAFVKKTYTILSTAGEKDLTVRWVSNADTELTDHWGLRNISVKRSAPSLRSESAISTENTETRSRISFVQPKPYVINFTKSDTASFQELHLFDSSSATDGSKWYNGVAPFFLTSSTSAGQDIAGSISTWVKRKDNRESVILRLDSNYEIATMSGSVSAVFAGRILGSTNNPERSQYIGKITPQGALKLEKWHLVTVTYDASELSSGVEIYIDGIKQFATELQSATRYTGMSGSFNSSAGYDVPNLRIGVGSQAFFDRNYGVYSTAQSGWLDSSLSYNGNEFEDLHNFTGEVLSVFYHNIELSPVQIQELYNLSNLDPEINVDAKIYPNIKLASTYDNVTSWFSFSETENMSASFGSARFPRTGFRDQINSKYILIKSSFTNSAPIPEPTDFFLNTIRSESQIQQNSQLSSSSPVTYLRSVAGKYSWPTWKQLRGSEHPITRAHRKDNTISIAVRGSEVMPSVHDEYLFDFNKDLQNISGINKKTVDRTFINYTEPMVTNRFNPMTITLHNEQVGGLSLENIRLMQEEAYLSQREEEDVWNLDEGLITAMVTSDTGPDGITRRPVGNRLLILRKTYQNDLTSFANANITDKLEIDDFKRHTFNDLLLSYQREFSTDEGTTMELNYVETIYPREENTYTKNARLRENFHFFGWNSSRTSRSIILTGSNAYNSSLVTAGTSNLFPEITVDKDDYQRTNPFFVDAVGSNSSVNPTRFTHVRASTWPLDARETFSRAPLSITSSFFNEGKDFLPFRKQGQFGEGVLQNDYSIFGLGVNTVHGTPPPAPIYSRRIPQTYSGNTFLAGEAKWEAADQSGQVPFVDSYEEYREKIRTLGQDHSIVPEFRISEFIEDTIKNNDGNFLASTSVSENFLSLTGAIYNQSSGDLEVGSSFFKTYATSDFMKYFNPIVEQTDIEGFKNDVDPMRLTLKCQAAMKFVPYRGFYPAERVLQIAELFGRGYMSDFSFTNTQQDTRISQTNSGVRNLLERKIRANLQQSIKPLMAPGILFNSIKSGMAVDYPLFGSDSDISAIGSFGRKIDRTTALTGAFGGQLKSLTMFTGSMVNQSTTFTGSVIPSSIPRLSGSVYKRVTFEDLLEPDRLRGTAIIDNEPHSSASIYYGNSDLGRVMDYPFRFGQLDTTRTEQKLNADSFSLKKPLSETLVPYKMAINNFCAETVNFFLEDGSSATLESDEVEVRLAASTEYKMRVYVRNKDLTMYDRHSAFGPPVDEGRSLTKAKFKAQQIIISGSGARKDMGFLVRNYDLASGSSQFTRVDSSLPGIVMTGSAGNKVSIKFVTASVNGTTNITNNPENGTTAEGTFNATSLGNIYLKGTSSYIDVNSIKTNFADPFGVKYDQDTNQYIDHNRSSALAQLIKYGVNVIAHNSSSGIVADVTLKEVTDKNLFPADVPSDATYLRYNLEFVQSANAAASGQTWRFIKENSTGSATMPQSRAEHWFENYPASGSREFAGGAADNPVTELTHKVNTTDNDSHGFAPFHPPFLDKNAEPYVEISFTPSSAGTYTLDQIWEGATFTYSNFYQKPTNATETTIRVADGDAANGMTEKQVLTLVSPDGRNVSYIIVDDNTSAVSTGDNVSITGSTDTGHGTADRNGVAVTIDTTGTPVTQNEFLVQLKAAIESPNGHGSRLQVSKVPSAADGSQSITITGLNTNSQLVALDETATLFTNISNVSIITPTSDKVNTPANYSHAMAISASIDLKSFVQYQAEENAPGSNRDGRKRWVIQSKWETPVLQFANVTASALKLSDNTVANVTNSPWQNRTWTQYFSQSLATSEPYLTASTGMWHQYGALPAKVGEGYELAVEEIEGLESSKQLARLVGFTSENKRSAKATPGRISEFKEIAESVVAIPYYVTDDDQVEFFDISEEIMLKARTLNEGRKRQLDNGTLTSEEYDKLSNTPGSNPTLLTAYQMRMMEKYVMPPQFDFVTYPKLAKTSRPMMYVFQFRAAMKKQDLQNIWQNLSPTSAVSTGKARYSATRANETKFGLESDVQYVSHFLDVDKTPFEGSDQKAFLEEKVRWIVFKVKMRAEKDLSKIKRESLPGLKSGKKIANTSIKDSGYFYKDDSNDPVINESRGINGLKYKHSFNWPYDYFSMVELIKVESKVDFLPKPPNQRN